MTWRTIASWMLFSIGHSIGYALHHRPYVLYNWFMVRSYYVQTDGSGPWVEPPEGE